MARKFPDVRFGPEADMATDFSDVRFGSKADMAREFPDVRFGPKPDLLFKIVCQVVSRPTLERALARPPLFEAVPNEIPNL